MKHLEYMEAFGVFDVFALFVQCKNRKETFPRTCSQVIGFRRHHVPKTGQAKNLVPCTVSHASGLVRKSIVR